MEDEALPMIRTMQVAVGGKLPTREGSPVDCVTPIGSAFPRNIMTG